MDSWGVRLTWFDCNIRPDKNRGRFIDRQRKGVGVGEQEEERENTICTCINKFHVYFSLHSVTMPASYLPSILKTGHIMGLDKTFTLQEFV